MEKSFFIKSSKNQTNGREIRNNNNNNNNSLSQILGEDNFISSSLTNNNQASYLVSSVHRKRNQTFNNETDLIKDLGSLSDSDQSINKLEIYPEKEEEEEVKDFIESQEFNIPTITTAASTSNINNITEYIKTPGPLEHMIKCKLQVKKGLFNEYYFYLEKSSQTSSIQFLMQAMRKTTTLNAFYWIYANQKRFGYLKSNLNKSNYFLIGDVNVDGANSGKKYFDLDFEQKKILAKPSPQDIQIEIILNDDLTTTMNNNNNNNNLFEKKLNKRFRIQTKKPYWDASTKKYKLDFKGRATRASSNNFQLIDCESNSLVYQCAKWKSNLYNIDFKYPINAFQAFGIAISCLSKK